MSINTTNQTNNGWHSVRDCYLSNITKEDWRSIRMQALDFLLSERLENYGYDYKSWNRLKNKRYRVKALLKVADNRLLHWKDLSDRLEVNLDDYSIRYIVGQSNNEEITNLMSTLIYGGGGNNRQ